MVVRNVPLYPMRTLIKPFPTQFAVGPQLQWGRQVTAAASPIVRASSQLNVTSRGIRLLTGLTGHSHTGDHNSLRVAERPPRLSSVLCRQ